jgi:CubicO group peptidase (beta-lactamase class C family)
VRSPSGQVHRGGARVLPDPVTAGLTVDAPGHAGPPRLRRRRPQDSMWRATITNVFSVTKALTALCALILAGQGELDPAAPVIRYWTVFATPGKEKMLVRHLFSHTAGLPTGTGRSTISTTGRRRRHGWLRIPLRGSRGTVAGDRSLTQTFHVGEVVRRITGRSLGEFFAEDVAEPLGADFHVGLTAEHDSRGGAGAVPPPFRDEDYVARAAGDSALSTAGTPVRVRDGNTIARRRAQILRRAASATPGRWPLVQSVMARG